MIVLCVILYTLYKILSYNSPIIPLNHHHTGFPALNLSLRHHPTTTHNIQSTRGNWAPRLIRVVPLDVVAGTGNYSASSAVPISGYSPVNASSPQTAPSPGYPPSLISAPDQPRSILGPPAGTAVLISQHVAVARILQN